MTLASSPAGVGLLLDGVPVSTPFTFNGVAGVDRQIEAPATETIGGVTYTFVGWSDGGSMVHDISTPAIDTTYTAMYQSNQVDMVPVVSIDNPVADGSATSPLNIEGVAVDDIGINRVQVSILKLGTNQYWDGTAFVDGWRWVTATLDDRGATSTAWTVPISVSTDTDVRIVAQARDIISFQRSVKTRIQSTTILANGNSTPPAAIAIDSPVNGSTIPNPVTIDGTVVTANLGRVELAIRKEDSIEWWNGSAWQSAWTRVLPTTDLATGTWSYNLNLPTPEDVILVGRARLTTGVLVKTSPVTVFR